MDKRYELTKEERKQVFSILLSARREELLTHSPAEIRAVSSFIGEKHREGITARDAFGFHKTLIALQTALLAARETGIRGAVLTACVLASAIDSSASKEDACKRFGSELHSYLDSFEEIDRLLETKREAMQTDNFRNLLVSVCGDMRVILLLIANNLNLMRQIRDTANAEGKQKLSTEAAYVYAPLAHKLGLYTLKSELEDLSLKYLEHDAYYHIKEKLSATKKSRDAYIQRFIAPLEEKMQQEGIRCHIKGRTKSIHSIWQKMKKQKCAFEGVYDLFAIRIIIEARPQQEQELCWKVFSLVTYEYESNLKRLRDWLTVPKSNGYESLHITVLGPENKWVEVQIRTERMDEVAEHGLAAHWRYKGVKSGSRSADHWLAEIRAALESGDEATMANNMTNKQKDDSVYVFSPKGDLYKLPAGATVLDFAYLIHTGVGNKCVGGRINGKNVPMRQKLESGQKVEISTSGSQTPKQDWLNIVVSPRAKSKIRAALNDLEAADGNIARETLERKLKNRKLEWDESVWNQLIKRLGYKEATEFYKDIASERVEVSDVIEQYAASLQRIANPQEHLAQHSAEEFEFDKLRNQVLSNDVLVIDKNLKGIDFQMAKCCHPVYGDDVFGFVTSGNGIKIHRTNCPNAPALRSRFAYRIVKAKWAGKGAGKYAITLRVVGNDDLGIVNNITSVISKEEKIMLRSISIDSNDGLFSGVLTVLVDDTQVLSALIKKLRTIKGVKAVSRN